MHVQVPLDMHASQLAHASEVVSPQVNKHIVLGKLFFVGKKARFERFVFLGGCATRPRSGQGKRFHAALLQARQRFGGCAGKLDVVA